MFIKLTLTATMKNIYVNMTHIQHFDQTESGGSLLVYNPDQWIEVEQPPLFIWEQLQGHTNET